MVPRPNNGTLRLPLKTIGLHDPSTSNPEPADPEPTPASVPGVPDGTIEISPIEASSAADPNVIPPTMVGVDIPEEDGGEEGEVINVDRPVVEDESEMTADEKNFWEWFKETFGAVKGWVASLGKGGDEDKEDGN